MKKNIFMLCMFVMFMSTVSNCDSGVTPESKEENTLFYTKWKLVGFFDGEKSELREAEPKDCDTCYTLDFGPDFTMPLAHPNDIERWVGRGFFVTFGFAAYYNADYALSTISFLLEKMGISDTYDSREYEGALYDAHTFDLNNAELKLFYGDKNDYLLFKLIGPSDTDWDWYLQYVRKEGQQ